MKSEEEQMCHGANLAMDHTTAPCKYIAPSPSSLYLIYSTKNNPLLHIAPPPASPCHFCLTLGISEY